MQSPEMVDFTIQCSHNSACDIIGQIIIKQLQVKIDGEPPSMSMIRNITGEIATAALSVVKDPNKSYLFFKQGHKLNITSSVEDAVLIKLLV